MEDNSPYLASKAELTPSGDGMAAEVPSKITRPIKYLWILLCVQAGIAVVWGGYQVITAPSLALFVGAIFGITAVINAACAFGVYNRVYWVAVVVTVLYGLSLVMELFSLLKATPSIIPLIVGVVTTIIGVRGTQAIRDYHGFVAASRQQDA